jgi:hypothetical protein
LTMANEAEQPQLRIMSYVEYAERFQTGEFKKVVNQIGFMCVRFQSLEAMVRSAIAYFLNPDDDAYGAIVTEKLTFKWSTRALRNLVEYHSEKNHMNVKLEDFDQVIKLCNECENDRNRVVHSLWYPSEEGPMRFKLKLDPGKVQPPPAPTSLEEIEKLTDKIVRARFALSTLFYFYFPAEKEDGELAASPEREPPPTR